MADLPRELLIVRATDGTPDGRHAQVRLGFQERSPEGVGREGQGTTSTASPPVQAKSDSVPPDAAGGEPAADSPRSPGGDSPAPGAGRTDDDAPSEKLPPEGTLTRRILDHLREHGQSHSGALSRALKADLTQVSAALSKLRKRGLVEKTGEVAGRAAVHQAVEGTTARRKKHGSFRPQPTILAGPSDKPATKLEQAVVDRLASRSDGMQVGDLVGVDLNGCGKISHQSAANVLSGLLRRGIVTKDASGGVTRWLAA